MSFDTVQLVQDHKHAAWCTLHGELAWQYHDGSTQCMFALIVESSTESLGCKLVPLLAQHVVDVLNRVHASDPTVLPALIEHRVPCNRSLADDPTVQVGALDGSGDIERSHEVGLLGIINGIVGVDADGWGYVAALSLEPGTLDRFEVR